MADESDLSVPSAPDEDADRKAHIAWIKRLKNKAALWDELRVLAVKRGVASEDEPHRVFRRRLVALLESEPEL